MRTHSIFSLAALAVVAITGSAMAQRGKPVAAPTGERQVAMRDTCSDSLTRRTAVSGAEAKRIASLAAGADSLFSAGQLEAARRTFKEIARAQTEIGANPAGALRRLANVELALDNTYAAATTLEDVAIAADRFDDPETQLGALVDAMLLYIDLGRRDRQSELVRQMRPLLKRAEIPEATRLSVRRLLHIS